MTQPFPGLYTTSQVALAGSETYVTMNSALDCATTEAMLAAGDWSILAEADLTPSDASGASAGSGMRWVILGRGSDLAIARLRGHEPCIGSIERLVRGPFRTNGDAPMDSVATMIPVTCVEGADARVAVVGFYDVDGGWFANLTTVLVPEVGSQSLSATDIGANLPTLAHIGMPMFEYFASGGDIGDSGELAPGDGFAGEVTIATTDPLAGTVRMDGLVDSEGHPAGLEATFSCHVAPFRGAGQVAPVDDQQGISLHLTSTLDLAGDFGVTATSEVDLEGVFDAVTARRYEATMTATGSGTFNETDYSDTSFKRRCDGAWSGTQRIDVAGEVAATSLHLTFTPIAESSLTWSKPCNAEVHAGDPTLPFASALSSSLDVAWPPGSASTDHQSVDLPIPGLGNDHWEVRFTDAP